MEDPKTFQANVEANANAQEELGWNLNCYTFQCPSGKPLICPKHLDKHQAINRVSNDWEVRQKVFLMTLCQDKECKCHGDYDKDRHCGHPNCAEEQSECGTRFQTWDDFYQGFASYMEQECIYCVCQKLNSDYGNHSNVPPSWEIVGHDEDLFASENFIRLAFKEHQAGLPRLEFGHLDTVSSYYGFVTHHYNQVREYLDEMDESSRKIL